METPSLDKLLLVVAVIKAAFPEAQTLDEIVWQAEELIDEATYEFGKLPLDEAIDKVNAILDL